MSLTDDYIDNREFGKPIHRYPVPASEADDQLPVFARVGRGIRGDGYKVKLIKNTADTVKLAGYIIDGATGQESSTAEWTSGNISGGQLMYSYNLRPYTDPQTFTITFRLKRPGQPEWQWTTPAIPYVWDEGQGGNIGSGVGTVYVKPYGGSWAEKLVYPSGMSRADFNGPNPGEPWSVNLTYGSNANADIVVPTMNELASIVGITVTNLRNIISGSGDKGLGGSNNLKAYIDAKETSTLNHLHNDLGFSSGYLAGDGGTGATNTVKKYIDSLISSIESRVKLLAHPIGSTYIQIDSDPNHRPEVLLGGTWDIISSDKYLKATTAYTNAGSTGNNDVPTQLTSGNVPLKRHAHYIAMTTNFIGADVEGDSGGAGTAGLADQFVGFGSRVMVSLGKRNGSDSTQRDTIYPPNADTMKMIDAGLGGDYNANTITQTGEECSRDRTGVEHVSTTINSPTYINVVIWRRRA